jgi:hypothetical protein
VTNRAPLQADAFLRLPPGSTKAAGWLATQLGYQLNGINGRMTEISHFLQYDSTGWINPSLVGWEELPYWLAASSSSWPVTRSSPGSPATRSGPTGSRNWLSTHCRGARPDPDRHPLHHQCEQHRVAGPAGKPGAVPERVRDAGVHAGHRQLPVLPALLRNGLAVLRRRDVGGHPDGGLAATLHGPSTVTAKVADGTAVTIKADTSYPFADTITYTVTTPKALSFPLYFRIPGWW